MLTALPQSWVLGQVPLLVALTLLTSQMATIMAVPLTLANCKVGVQMEELPLGISGHWGLGFHTQRTTVVSVASQLQAHRLNPDLAYHPFHPFHSHHV